MHTLLFKTPEFNAGMMITCRKGTKWARQVAPGDVVKLESTDSGTSFGYARIIGVILTTLNELPSSLLQYEHDPNARTWSDLFKEMQRVYGSFEIDEQMTVLMFKRDPGTGVPV